MPPPAANTTQDSFAADREALDAYEALAQFYDDFTRLHDHPAWLAELEAWASTEGLPGRRVLDVACGTGKSSLPMAAKGYDVTACDISPAMVREARRKAPELPAYVADMRALPWVNEFDLVTCLDDALNYLLRRRDLTAAMSSMARALKPGGILVFDVNTLRTFRTDFAGDFETRYRGRTYRWKGCGSPSAGPGSHSKALLSVERASGAPVSSLHHQRHWRIAELSAACRHAGLLSPKFRGQVRGGRLGGDPDEHVHSKIVCLAAHPTAADRVPRSESPGERSEHETRSGNDHQAVAI